MLAAARDVYFNYSSNSIFFSVHWITSRLKMYVDFISLYFYTVRSIYVPRWEYRCRLISSAPLPASEGAWSYYTGKLRSLVDIGDTSRKRFSCTGCEQNPLVIGITSSLTLCTSDPVCVNGTRRTEEGATFLSQHIEREKETCSLPCLPIGNVQSAISGWGHEFYYKTRARESWNYISDVGRAKFGPASEDPRWISGFRAGKFSFYSALIRSTIRSGISYAPNGVRDL